MDKVTYPLKIIPLGGLGEIGQNMMVVEYHQDIVVIDAGLLFPGNDMPGVELGVPDTTYLEKNQDRVKAILITHGHEDHIGALSFLLSKINAPVYSSRLTNSLIFAKLKQASLIQTVNLQIVEPQEKLFIGDFEIEFFRVCHSIPDSMGIAIKTPYGTIIHTGDFKIDHTPADGIPFDFVHLSELARDGVLLLCSDSTYAEVDGYTNSEKLVGAALDSVIEDAPGRVIIVTFASLISRVQQIIDSVGKHKRKVSLVGRSMNTNIKMALRMGYAKDEDNVMVSIRESRKLPLNKIVYIATGSQGEPNAAITRISNGNHPDINIIKGDTVVLSSSPIPGNETSVARTIDSLFRRGARVIYNRIAPVHVRGHASREELKIMIRLTKPKYFLPIHGEYRHLAAHANIAKEMGLPEKSIFVIEDGEVLEITEAKAQVIETVPSGTIYLDNKNADQTNDEIIRERRNLAHQGIIIAGVTISNDKSSLIAGPKLVSVGFSDEHFETESLKSASKMVQVLLEEKWLKVLDLDDIESEIAKTIADHIYKETKKRPMVLPLVERIE